MIDRDQMKSALYASWVRGVSGAEYWTAEQEAEWLDAQDVADPDTLVISKVDGEWPSLVAGVRAYLDWQREVHPSDPTGRLQLIRSVLDALLEGPHEPQ